MKLPMLPLADELEAMRARLDRMMGDAGLLEITVESEMPIDLKETPEAYTVSASLPGAKPEQVAIDLNDNRLTISMSSEESTERETEGYLVRERRTGSLRRMITLPGPVAEADVDATLKDGVLTLTMPKAEDRKHSIKVRSS